MSIAVIIIIIYLIMSGITMALGVLDMNLELHGLVSIENQDTSDFWIYGFLGLLWPFSILIFISSIIGYWFSTHVSINFNIKFVKLLRYCFPPVWIYSLLVHIIRLFKKIKEKTAFKRRFRL